MLLFKCNMLSLQHVHLVQHGSVCVCVHAHAQWLRALTTEVQPPTRRSQPPGGAPGFFAVGGGVVLKRFLVSIG